MADFQSIRQHIQSGQIDQALTALDAMLDGQEDVAVRETCYYLKGNAYRTRSDWQQALNNYKQAMALNSDSPAATAYEMLMNILNFYHKDAYNP